MSKNSNLGGSSNMRTQIQNLWQAINTIEAGGGGGGTGNMNYIGGSTTVGQHYKATSTTGLNCDKSSIIETNTDFTFGNKNLGAIGIISGDSFVKSGGSNQQYLMADGSSLTYSGNSGNSNYYLFLNGTGGTTPADGYITYNQNPFQFQSTMIYISHLTRDGIDIEVFFKQLTILSEVYIQDQSSAKFMQFNITGAPTITAGQNVAIPVVIRTSNTTALAPNRQIMISFFTNTIEIDTRLSTLETNTQNQTAVSNQTDFAGTIQADTIKISASSPNLHLMSDGSTRDITTVTNGGPVGGQSLVKIGYGTNPSIQLNSVSAFNGVGLTLNNGNISFSNTATLSNAGILTGLSLVSNGTAPNYSLKSIEAGTSISLINNSDVITISNTSPASGISLASVAGGTSLISSTSANPSFKTKSITQGSGISISDVSNNLTISTATPYLPLTGGTMSGNIDLSGNQLINCNSLTQSAGKTLTIGNNNISYNSYGNTVVGSTNTSSANEQWIFGAYNTVSNNISVAVGSYNNVNSFNGNALGRSNTVSAGYSNAIGYNNTCSGIYSVAIGNDITNSTPNSVCLGDSAITTIYPNSLVCDLGTSAKPYKDIHYTGKLVNATTPILNITNSATLYYNNATLTTSNSGLIPIASMTVVGGLPTQVTQGTTTAKDKIFKTLLPESSVASFQDAGLLGNTSFLLNSQSLYVGMGWNIKISFGVADTNVNAISPAGMFVGLVSQNTINWSAVINPSTLLSCIGVGHNYGDSLISTYFKGSASGTTTATTWNTTTPDSRWFHLTLTNLFNSNDVILTLTETISNVSVTQTFTCGSASSVLAPNIRLYPCIQRIIGNTASSGSGRIHLGQFTYNQLI